MNNSVLKLDIKKSMKLFLIICVVFILAIIIGMNQNFSIKEFLEPITLVLTSIFSLAFILYTRYLLQIPEATIINNEIELKTIFKNPITKLNAEELNGYYILRENRNTSANEILYLIDSKNDKEYRFESLLYSNYENFKKFIHDHVKLNDFAKTMKVNRNYKLVSAMFFILSLGFFLIASLIYNRKNCTHFKELTGTLSKDVRIKDFNDGDIMAYIQLNEFGNQEFRIDNMSMEGINVNELKNKVRTDDTITMKIAEADYLKSIKGTMKLTYVEKYSAYDEIDIIELKSKNEYYLTMDNYNRMEKENRNWGIGSTLIFGILFLVFGIIYKLKLKPATNMVLT